MSLKNRALILSIVFAVLFYLIDSLVDFTIFYRESGFFNVFVANPPIYELYTRLIGMAVIVIMGILLPVIIISDKRSLKPPESSDYKISTDPSLMINISNQIRTPLNAIIGFVDLLMNPKISDASKVLYLYYIRTSGRYLAELINNITDITKIETGELYLKKEECHLNGLLSSLYDQYEKYIKEKGKKDLGLILKTGIKDESYTIIIDQDRLKQVLTNLLENALSFTDEGTIEFGYHLVDSRTLEFFVKDTGTGFSMERLERILKQFTKVMDTRMRPFDLAALRINISKHIIKLMRGELKADSRLGHGSDFRFQIPLKQIETIVSEEKEIPSHKLSGTSDYLHWKGKNILIAEDVESNFIYLQEILRPSGANISWAENGKEAVELCQKKGNFDVIIMDILMPEMDGYEAAKVISKEFPGIPIIAQTAYSLEEDDYKDAMNYFKKYLIKPIWSHDLLKTLSDIFPEL